MRIFKTALAFQDVPDGTIYKCDTIEYQGAFWLVPEWLENPDAGVMIPARIICLDGLIHQTTPDNPGADFWLNTGIPKSVFDGAVPPGDKYVMIERPDIKFPIPNDES